MYSAFYICTILKGWPWTVPWWNPLMVHSVPPDNYSCYPCALRVGALPCHPQDVYVQGLLKQTLRVLSVLGTQKAALSVS